MVLSLDSHTYCPNDNVNVYVYNATAPLVSVIDPSGNAYDLTMLRVNDSAYSGTYALTSGVVLSNYTVKAIDNATGFIAEDQFAVVSRSVTVTPLAGNVTMPSGNTSATPLYLYMSVSRPAYSPGDRAEFTVNTNVGVPTLTVKDPAGKITQVTLSSGQNNIYSGVYGLDQAVVLGNYTATAAVNCNGTYTYTTAYFNVTLGDDLGGDGVSVRLVAYDPIQKAFVIKADMASNMPVTAVNDTPAIKGLAVKGLKVMQSGVASQPAGTSKGGESKQIEVIVPADDGSVSTISQRYNVSKDIAKATLSDSISADGTKVHVSLNDKVDGCWYRMSMSIPAGYTVDKIVRADGTEIKNDVQTDRATGAVIKDDVNWYVDNGTLYFYDDPINGYDVTLNPPAASNSISLEVWPPGQLSALVYPYNQSDSSTTIASNDQLGFSGDSYANDIDSHAGSKTGIRINNIVYGNGDTDSGYGTTYTDTGKSVVTYNKVPDGSVESVITDSFTAPSNPGVSITMKTIIRNNNAWFATVYYIMNANSANNANNVRFYQGCDFNFNSQTSNDNMYYSQANDAVYGYKNTNPNGVPVSGFKSPLASTAHDVSVYSTMWSDISSDKLNNNLQTLASDGGVALAWDNQTLAHGQTWTVPVIWAVGNNVNSFFSTLNYATNNNVYDVGISGISSPANGTAFDAQATPSVDISVNAMDVGVTDQTANVVLQIYKPGATTPYYTTSKYVSLSIPSAESASVDFPWDITQLPPGLYTITAHTELKNSNNVNIDQNSANDYKTIQVYIRNFSIKPDQSASANPGDNVLYTLTASNQGSNVGTFDFNISQSTAGWPTFLYDGDVTKLMASDTNGDGLWDWVNASYDKNGNNMPDLTLSASSSGTVIVKKSVPYNADYGISDNTTISINLSGSALPVSSANLTTSIPPIPVANKTFYVHDPNMNTSPDTRASPSSTMIARGGGVYITQQPAFASDFYVTGNMVVSLWLSQSNNRIPSKISLYYSNGVQSTLIGSTTNTWAWGNGESASTIKLFTFNIAPANGAVTIPAGYYLALEVDNTASNNNRNLYVFHDSSHQSKVDVNTNTYVKVTDIWTSDGTTNKTVFSPGNPIVVTANVIDPIGSYDIAGAKITVNAPDGSIILNNASMTASSTSTALSRIYTYPLSLGSNPQPGVYVLSATGVESNGVTYIKKYSITIQAPLSVTATKTITPTGNNKFLVTVTVKNNNAYTNHGIYAYDFYPNSFTPSSYSQAPSSIVSVTWNGGGNVNVWGPIDLAGGATQTFTYTATGSSGYKVSDLEIVGVDPHV